MITLLKFRNVAAATLAVTVMTASAAEACDDLADKLLSSYVGPAIKSLGCSELRRAGVDVPQHKLDSICYTSSGPTSSIKITASLNCRTSDAALIKTSVSEHVTAEAEVRGADCHVQNVQVRPSGEIGKILVQAFNVDGLARKALQDGLDKMCSSR